MTKKIDKAWNKIQIVLENNELQRCISAKKVIQLFRYIEHNDYNNNQSDSGTESFQKLTQYVSVNYFILHCLLLLFEFIFTRLIIEYV